MRYEFDTRQLDELRQRFQQFSDTRFQSGLAAAVNETAFAVRDVWGGQIVTRLDRPTRLSSRAPQVVRADVGRLVAEIRLSDSVPGDPGGVAPSEYLATQARGAADRRVKKFERALQSAGAMPAGWKVVPGRYAQRDAWGNISRHQIIEVLNQLGQDLSPGYQKVISRNAAKRAASAARAGRVYVAIPRRQGQLEAGVYYRDRRGNLLPVFFFVSRTRYAARLPLDGAAGKTVAQLLPAAINKAMAARLRTFTAKYGTGA